MNSLAESETKVNGGPETDTEDFLNILYGRGKGGYLVLWTKQDKLPCCFPAPNWGPAAKAAMDRARTRDVYFGIGLQRDALPPNLRGSSDKVGVIPGCWQDIDIRGPNHTEKALPESLEQATELAYSFPLPPTMIIFTGGGVQPHWLFEEPRAFESDEQRREAQQLSRRFQATVQIEALKHGWKLDNTSDLARLLRLPGTFNRKHEPVEVRVLEYHPDRRYSPSDFERFLVPKSAPVTPPLTKASGKKDFPPAKIEPIVNGCAWIRHCRDDAERLTEPEWHAVLSIVGRCENGEKLTHDWSKPYARYSPAETSRKLEHALRAAGPRTCKNIRQNGGEPYCNDCPNWRRIRSPIVLGSLPSASADSPEDQPGDKDALGATVGGITDFPEVIITNRELRNVSNDCLNALYRVNDPPSIYVRGGNLVRMRVDEKGTPRIEMLTASPLAGSLTRCANFTRISANGRSERTIPPASAILDILCLGEWRFPALAGIAEIPVIRPDGSVHATTGYDPITGLIYLPKPGFVIPPLSNHPTPEDVRRAVSLVNEALGEFPFVDEASRAAGWAACLTPILRPYVPGATPLILFDAPRAGTGKGLLADVVARIAIGRPAAMMMAPCEDEEMRKRLTAMLLDGSAIIVFDNLNHPLESPSLAAAITAPVWKDRILGRSESVSLPVRATWIATGNDIQLGGDLPRRSVLCRLDAKVARPWTRSGFKHPDLPGWVDQNRGELVAALLTLSCAWIAEGCPPANTPIFGGFEDWTRAVGGVLQVAGIRGFLRNQDELYERADDETAQWEAFLSTWWEIYGCEPRTAAELTAEMKREADTMTSGAVRLRDVLPDDLAESWDTKSTSFSRKLGNALSSKLDVRYGDLHLAKVGTRQLAALWAVIKTAQSKPG